MFGIVTPLYFDVEPALYAAHAYHKTKNWNQLKQKKTKIYNIKKRANLLLVMCIDEPFGWKILNVNSVRSLA